MSIHAPPSGVWDGAYLLCFRSFRAEFTINVWSRHRDEGGILRKGADNSCHIWDNYNNVLEVKDRYTDLHNVPPVLNEFPLKGEYVSIECGVAAGEVVLPFFGVGVEARSTAVDDGESK